MKFEARTEWNFLALIVAAALLKFALLGNEPPLGNASLAARIQQVLSASGFQVGTKADPPLGDIVYGQKQSCRLWARDYDPYGNSLNYFQEQASTIGALRFAYNGHLQSRAPKFEPLVRYYLTRELSRAGFRVSRRPIVAVAASAGCDLDAIAWSQVAEVPW